MRFDRTKHSTHIRFGRIPRSGFSLNHQTGEKLSGLACYKAWVLADGKIRINWAGLNSVLGVESWVERPCFEIAGIQLLEYGPDGEPLLWPYRVLRRLGSGELLPYWNKRKYARFFSREQCALLHDSKDRVYDEDYKRRGLLGLPLGDAGDNQ